MSERYEKYVFNLDEDARKYCVETLHETEESRSAALTTLKQWAEDNPRFHVKVDDRSLLAFLRGCKFDLDRTKAKLIDHYTMRRDVPEWYAKRDPALSEIQDLVKLGIFVPLRRDHDRQLVVIIRVAAHDPKVHDQNNVFKAGNMILDAAVKDNEEAQIFGIIAIFDMTGVTFGHARQLTPGIIKKAVRSWQNYHCRPKRLEFINAPVYVNVILSIFKSFMSEKLKSRIQVHYNRLEGLHSVLPKEILPRDYGGEAEPLDDLISYWQQRLSECSDWFAEDEKFKAE
ncbi:CRAL TRIO domain containing protein [Asbolus verrucosus]|uniref:CRAL TRIO domain containing protein n=1 Tax=Asbolus verrucosus TaxID=1661398 RepID=A0A482VUX0_ASBVE|nr:CRAL TRIO domain containing protein [Asbolus verrucosus]